eukprot:733652-Amphidinium_carterae.1
MLFPAWDADGDTKSVGALYLACSFSTSKSYLPDMSKSSGRGGSTGRGLSATNSFPFGGSGKPCFAALVRS